LPIFNNKPVAFVCHSPAALKNVKVNGEFLVKGKNLPVFQMLKKQQ
jgi:putative intracellular protease/amidase